jgi:hypothetical protein
VVAGWGAGVGVHPVAAFPDRLADLWWLLAHDVRGRAVVGPHHFAIGLAACALGEVFTQVGGGLDAEGNVVVDGVVAHVVGEVRGAARERVVKPARAWVEWLAANEVHELERAVVVRMVGNGWLFSDGRHTWPKDSLTAFTPVTALITAAGGGHAVSDAVRVLAGVTSACGLAPLVGSSGEDMVRPLQLLAMELPRSVYGLVAAVDDAVHALATRLR